MRLFVALAVAFLATCVSASPLTVPLTKPQGTGAYLKGVPDADRARAAFLQSRAYGGSTSANAPLTNFGYTTYTASVGIGEPPTYYNLVVDTGSANTFCGTGIPYVQTSTSVATGYSVNVTYGSGNWTGLEYLDQVTLSPSLVIKNQSIGDALSYAQFQGVDGIIGFGPVILTTGTLRSYPSETIPTVMNNLVSENVIEKQVLGVYYAPSTNYTEANGVLTVGGVDPSLYEGELKYIPVTETHPAGYFWGFNITSSTYGDHIIIPTSTAGIVDTGTTQILLANDFFDAYMNAIPGATFDNATGLLEIPPSSVQDMQSLSFQVCDDVFILDAAAQLVPTYQNEASGGVAGKQYGVIGNLGTPSGDGFDFVLGQKFSERYYTVFDTDANRIGFAQTNNTFTS